MDDVNVSGTEVSKMKDEMKRSRTKMPGLIIYVILSAMGLTLIKIGTGQDISLFLNAKGFSLRLNWILVIGMLVYIISFLTSMLVMKNMNLSIFYPVSAGLIYIVICGLSYFVLREKISINQWIGMSVILVGIIIMNLGKNG